MSGAPLVLATKLAIYDTVATTTKVPTVFDVAKRLGASPADVQAAFDELHEQRLLVPEPGDAARIRMAPPFSGIETPFRVTVGAGRGNTSYYANCVWDALGIAAALHEDVVVHTSDGHTGEPMTLVVKDGAPVPEPCIVHIGVPAAHWWDDIIYT